MKRAPFVSPTRRRSREAMTLVEVVVSFSLLTLILMPVIGLAISSRQSVADARFFTQARTTAESQVERLKALANVDEATFGALAAQIAAAPNFTVPGLPTRPGGAAHGRLRVVLDERDLDGNPVDANTDIEMNLGGVDLNANGSATDVLAPTALYRVLPVRVEVFWGAEAAPKLTLDVLIAPRFNFRRTS